MMIFGGLDTIGVDSWALVKNGRKKQNIIMNQNLYKYLILVWLVQEQAGIILYSLKMTVLCGEWEPTHYSLL